MGSARARARVALPAASGAHSAGAVVKRVAGGGSGLAVDGIEAYEALMRRKKGYWQRGRQQDAQEALLHLVEDCFHLLKVRSRTKVHTAFRSGDVTLHFR